MTLAAFLTWLLSASSGGGLGVLGWALVNWLDAHWSWLAGLRYDLKRAVVYIIVVIFSAGLAAPLLLFADWLAVRPLPATPQDWVSTLFEIAAYAVVSSQMAHGVEEARRG